MNDWVPQVKHILGRPLSAEELRFAGDLHNLNPEQLHLVMILKERQLLLAALYLGHITGKVISLGTVTRYFDTQAIAASALEELAKKSARISRLESDLRSTLGWCQWLAALIPHTNWDCRGYAQGLNSVEKTLEANPDYLRGKQDRIAGKVCEEKNEAYRAGYWLGMFGVDVPPAKQKDGMYEVEHAEQEARMVAKVKARWRSDRPQTLADYDDVFEKNRANWEQFLADEAAKDSQIVADTVNDVLAVTKKDGDK